MKKFILLDHEPWTIRRKQLFYDLFEKAKIKLYVWDLSQWLNPGLSNPDELKNIEYLTRVLTENQFVSLLENEDSKNVIFVEEVFRSWDNRRVFRHISDLGFDTIKIELYGNSVLKQRFMHRVKFLNINNLPKTICGKLAGIKIRAYNKIRGIKGPIRIFSSNGWLYRTDAINHPDYENYKFNSHENIIGGDYIVFCDIFFPFHSDLKHFYKIKRLPDGKKYQETMRRYFDYLEEKYGMPVVIAAHPKSDYSEGEFGNRSIIKYKTDDLVFNARMVTLHVCNSISYALLSNKPIAFVATEDYIKLGHVKKTLDLLAHETLGLSYYILGKVDLNEVEFKKVNEDLRIKYINNYLTSTESSGIQNYKILRKELMELSNEA